MDRRQLCSMSRNQADNVDEEEFYEKNVVDNFLNDVENQVIEISRLLSGINIHKLDNVLTAMELVDKLEKQLW